MMTDVLRSAFAWTFKGLLCTWRFFWVCPYAIKCLPKEPCIIGRDQVHQTTGCESRVIPDSHERSSAIHKRLSKVEKDIQALKTQIATERASWERRFLELQMKQQDLHNQLISKTLGRTGFLLKVGSIDDRGSSEVENGLDEKEHDNSSSARHSYQQRGSNVMSSRGDNGQSNLSESQLTSASRSTSASATSMGSWRTSVGPHRVFIPHSPLDLQLGHRVRILLASGRINTGTICYLGLLQGEPDFHLGVKLETAEQGQQDGTHAGHRYFECKPGHGAFVPFNKLLMAWE